MTRVTSAELLARLEQARRALQGGGVLATDGDGTLWRGDIGDELFIAALDGRALKNDALEALIREAEAHDVALGSREPNDVARRLFEAYRAGRYPEASTFEMMAWSFAGWHEDELGRFAARVLDAYRFGEKLRTEMLPVLAWAKERGMEVWLVSASPLSAVQEAARRLGLALERVVAMTPATSGGVVQPALGLDATYAEGKMRRLRAATADALLASFGDSRYDAAMLRAAIVPVAVHPTPGLAEQLDTIPGALVLE